MLVSFIVPIYNAEPYLERCLSSIVHQGLLYKDYEVILVNDGSTDSSLQICDIFSQKHPNIIVKSQPCGGVSSARNTGISCASGKWICLVDSDDYLNTDAISSVLRLSEMHEVEMVRFWSRTVDEGFVDDLTIPGTINFMGTGFDFIKRFGLDAFCCTYLFNRQWLLSTGILFENVKIAEDYLFISKLLLHNPSIISTTVRGYNYVKHASSITGNRRPEHSTLLARSYPHVIETLFEYEDKLLIHDCEVKNQVLNSAQDKMRSFISRVLSSNIDNKEFKLLVKIFETMKVLPIRIDGNMKNRMVSHTVNWICYHPRLLKLMQRLYVNLVIPFILPRIKHNQLP